MLLEERTGQAVTEAEAEKLAHELYGLVVAANSLPGEYDDNFHLTNEKAGVDAAGRAAAAASFVLKVMHPGRGRDFVELQFGAGQHLAGRSLQSVLPGVCP